MAAPLIAYGSPPRKAGAAKRRDAALTEIDKRIMQYARERYEHVIDRVGLDATS
jgi:hypothetical protein